MQVTYRELPSSRRFGVELEVSNNWDKQYLGGVLADYEKGKREVRITPGIKGWAESRGNKYWHVKYDSTCGHKGKGKDSGWEVASYIGKGIADVSSIAGAAQALGDEGVTVTRNCGLHVHVDAADLTRVDMGGLLANWIKAEKYLLYLCHPSRHENKYCRTLTSRYNKLPISYMHSRPGDFWLQMAPGQLQTHNNPEKKYTLNTVGYALGSILDYYDRKTVELRLPECRLEKKHVKNWVQLMLHFVDFCKNRSAPSDLMPANSVANFLQIMGLHSVPGDFPLLERRLWNTKVWLLQKLANSATATRQVRAEALEMLAFISEV
jgi:hypothetical protein